MRSKWIVVGMGFAIWMMAVVFAAGQQTAASAPTATPKAAPAKVADDGNGDVIWEQNCSRCHAAPQGFSPRISGTVIRHMRVRASLSKEQERELLRFLNP